MSAAVMTAESTDGTLIACERRAAAPASVLVGGALCRAASDAPPAGPFAPQFSVFTHDRRGRGRAATRVLCAVGREIEDGGASPVGTRAAARAVATALPRGRHHTWTGRTHEVAPLVVAPTLFRSFRA